MSQPIRPSHLIKPKTGPDDPELQETLHEGLRQVAPDDVVQLTHELLARRERLLPALAVLASGSRPAPPLEQQLVAALAVTSKQARAAESLLQQLSASTVLPILLSDTRPVEERLVRVVTGCGAVDQRLALEVATGLLHLLAPGQYWLWTRWLWDIRHNTGILPLLASSTHAVQADDIGTQYRQLGAVIAIGAELGRNSGLLPSPLADDPERGPFATDAFLAIAYSVYLYGITNWRLSREFNRLLPPLPDLARRLLGLPRPARAIA
ncbi:hypothetical protein HRbin27_00582 [bacterium HR27]|nr:hypothetical protein HRbin27_00582 [bacterium HR27]